MPQNKKVKIYVDVYNGEKYVSQCIESVLNQTYTNFEFYVVDNNSKDSCPDIISEYAKKDSRIIPILSNENKQARWIKWMNDWDDDCYFTIIDHDDWWDKNYLSKLINNLETNRLDLVFGTSYLYFDSNKKLAEKYPQLPQKTILDKIQIPQNYFDYWVSMSTVWGCIYKVRILKLIETELIKLVEIKYAIGGDTILTLNYIKKCNKIGIFKEPLYYYRQHDTNMTSINKYNPQYFNSVVMFVSEFENYAKENNIDKQFDEIFFSYLINTFARIEKSTLLNDEKYNTYVEILEHDMTIKYLKLSQKNQCDSYSKLLFNLNRMFEKMTDTILSNFEIESYQKYLEFYINLSKLFKSKIGELVGKLKLAKYLFDDNKLDEYDILKKELSQLGFDLNELDLLLSELTYNLVV